MKKFIFILLSFFSILSADMYENKQIEKIEVIIKNNPNRENKVIHSLETKQGSQFSQKVFDKDLKYLSKKFEKVEPSIIEENNKLFISLKIEEKPKVSLIKFQGNKHFKTKKLKKELGIKINDPLNKEKLKKGLQKIRELYIKKGFFELEIAYKIDKENDSSKIDIKINEGRCGKIKQIEFEGFTSNEISKIQSLMHTKKYNLLSFMTGNGFFKKEAIEYDKMNIINFLNEEGYADASVKIKILEEKKSSKIIVKIIAIKGVLYHFGKISFSGNTIFTNEEIKNRILINQKNAFSFEKVRQTAKSIKNLYGQKGYIDTEVLQETYLLEKNPIYDVHFKIEEKGQFKIGLIHIIGNNQTKENVILRESLLIPGEIFNSRKLDATRQRLINMQYFKSVNVYALQSKTSDMQNYKDVYIEVEEGSTGSANLSLGYSPGNNIFTSFDLTERNFNIAGFLSIFKEGPSALRGAGEYGHTKITIGKKQRTYLFSWVDPYFRDSLWRFGWEASKTFSKLQSKDYKVITYGSSIFTSYPITNFWTFGTKYRLRHSDTKLKKTKTKQDIKIEDNHGLISAISCFLSYDSTNRAYKPTRGLRSNLDAEFSGVGGDFYFYKFNYLNTLFIPIWQKGTLKGKANLRFLEPIGKTNKGDLPISERFFLGGEPTVRGYKPYILGPRRRQNPSDPIGGISSALFSVEYIQYIIPRVDIFCFFDAGSVSNKHFAIPKINSSYGLGISLEIMNRVPLILGYGIPINPDRKEDKQKFFFSFGGQF